MTWVAYHSDLSEVAVFGPSSFASILETELNARRYAMENSMSVIDLPDGEGLRETINAPSRAARAAADQARLLGPDIPPDDPEPSLVDSDLAAIVRETLDLGGTIRLWSGAADEQVRIERYTPGTDVIRTTGCDLSQALIDYRVKEAQQTHG